ncbi:PAS domain-containing sensor histidine kinase [Laspinema palackyanum]|uniref:PAS domain-containing sensor histidine kinase n=1 Tax=Laspinema palackyanum TaxID=3231601 RepID=UPI00345D9BCB
MLTALKSEYKEPAEVQELHQQLAASEIRFRNVIDKLADGIIIVDGKGLVRFINRAAECLLSCQADALLGKEVFGTRVFEIQGGQIGTEIIQRVGDSDRDSTRVVQTQVEILRKGQEDAIAEMRIVETEWEGEKALMASLRDITSRVRALEALQKSEAQLREQTQQLERTLQQLKQTQSQLIQTEKMSSLGQMVAGVAHEINNPVNFIYGNIDHASCYIEDLMGLMELYEQHYPNPVEEITQYQKEIDLEFLSQDLPKLLSSMKLGTDRIREIVMSLRNFSRLDEAQMKRVNIHEGIDSTLLILQNRLKARSAFPGIELVKEYGDLEAIECYAGQLNQVFMNIISNSIDAIEESSKFLVLHSELSASTDEGSGSPKISPQIKIATELVEKSSANGDRDETRLVIKISDNGPGMSEEVRQRLFDPFFTTKPVGKGTGLGLSISYHIVVEKHGGQLQCISTPDEGTEFIIEIPIQQQKRKSSETSTSRSDLRPQTRFQSHLKAC